MPNYSGFSRFCALTGTQMLIPQLIINIANAENVTQHFTRELYKSMAQFDLRDFSKRPDKSQNYIQDKLQICDKV